jgi:hypothetical protein
MGVKVEHASYVFRHNLGVIQNVTIKNSLLKKKHVAISYHKTREATAVGTTHPVKILGTRNYADCLTKSLTEKGLRRFNKWLHERLRLIPYFVAQEE